MFEKKKNASLWIEEPVNMKLKKNKLFFLITLIFYNF